MWRHRGKKTSTKREDVRTYIPFQRVKAEIQNEVTKAIVEGRVFLNDLSASGVGLFTPTPLVTGDKVSIVIEEPKHIFIKGKVIWCAQYTMSTKIITNIHMSTYILFFTKQKIKLTMINLINFSKTCLKI